MIVTFYSFKGGVGRSMAVANIGAWLYLQGRRVLLVDWDLEAPGLESFFLHTWADLDAIRAKPGLVDLVESYRQLWQHSSSKGERTVTDKVASLTEKIGPIRHLFNPLADTPKDATSTRQPGIWLLHAGCRAGASEPFYRRSVHALDWGRFYEESGGYFFMEWLRRELEKDVDFVPVDSRTGVTEMGGVYRRRVLGEEHPDTLQSMNNLAETLRALCDLPGARSLAERALEGCRRVLGEEHPDTAKAGFALMLIAHQQGDTDRINSLIRSSPAGVSAQLKAWLESQGKPRNLRPAD